MFGCLRFRIHLAPVEFQNLREEQLDEPVSADDAEQLGPPGGGEFGTAAGGVLDPPGIRQRFNMPVTDGPFTPNSVAILPDATPSSDPPSRWMALR